MLRAGDGCASFSRGASYLTIFGDADEVGVAAFDSEKGDDVGDDND